MQAYKCDICGTFKEGESPKSLAIPLTTDNISNKRVKVTVFYIDEHDKKYDICESCGRRIAESVVKGGVTV